MLNDRDRNLLNDLERQLHQEDAAWIRQFKDSKAPRQAQAGHSWSTDIGSSCPTNPARPSTAVTTAPR
jgi:hypothetical protein